MCVSYPTMIKYVGLVPTSYTLAENTYVTTSFVATTLLKTMGTFTVIFIHFSYFSISLYLVYVVTHLEVLIPRHTDAATN
jgi:hypothetical protein